MMPAPSNKPALHPSEELLAQHAGGALPLARRVLLESHFSFCPDCRAAAAELARPGGRHLRSLPGAPAPAALWQKIAARVAGERTAPRNLLDDTPLPLAGRAELPPFHQPLEWGTLPGSPSQIALLLDDPQHELQLFLIHNPPDSTFPYHRHLGNEDLLVLQGAFTDRYGHYGVGDLQLYAPGTDHEPRIDPEETCWAITCVQSGVSFER